MIIRIAKKSDIDKNLFNLYIEGYNMHYEKRKDIFPNQSKDQLKDSLIEMLNNPNKTILVLDNNETIVGYASLQIKHKATKSIWIDEIIVDKKYQHKGYGKILIDEIYKFAKDNDCKRVELSCWSFNSNAIEFYNKLDFIEQRIVFEKEIK